MRSLSDTELTLRLQELVQDAAREQGEDFIRADFKEFSTAYVDWLLHGQASAEEAAQWDGGRCLRYCTEKQEGIR